HHDRCQCSWLETILSPNQGLCPHGIPVAYRLHSLLCEIYHQERRLRLGGPLSFHCSQTGGLHFCAAAVAVSHATRETDLDTRNYFDRYQRVYPNRIARVLAAARDLPNGNARSSDIRNRSPV